MDQVKIGEFIKQRRKEQNITQSEMAELLNISDRAISKWENGICMPDSGIMLELCKILNISINDLFSGKIVDNKKYNVSAEENMIRLVKMKEESDKRLLDVEIIMAIVGILPLLISLIVIIIAPLEEWIECLIIFTSIIPLLVDLPFLIKIEQIAGYYECYNCGNRYVPRYKSVFFASHIGRKRYMKCPKCNKYSWNKKVLSGSDNND